MVKIKNINRKILIIRVLGLIQSFFGKASKTWCKANFEGSFLSKENQRSGKGILELIKNVDYFDIKVFVLLLHRGKLHRLQIHLRRQYYLAWVI